jgi:fermentation-respiration switch protein FrsA (DUF1100 family)
MHLPVSHKRRLDMRREITFTSQGLRCAGWIYVPEGLVKGQKAPAIILANGFAGEKEWVIPDYAEQFVRAGFVALVFDYRYFGDSKGEPRHQLFPLEQVEDVRNAISWVSDQPEVDPRRIGLWGISQGGGTVIYAATYDKRVKAVVGQVPLAISTKAWTKLVPERWKPLDDFLIKDRVERYRTGAINYFKVVSSESEPCFIPGKETYDEYMTFVAHSPKSKQTWFNGITMESLEKVLEFDPVNAIPLLAPTPLLLVAAKKDNLLPIEAIRETYRRAGEPKALSVLPISHFEINTEPWLIKSAGEAINWYNKYL